MLDISIHNNIFTRRSGSETLRIEPWGQNSLRVRSTMNAEIAGHDWALLKPEHEVSIDEIEITLSKIRNGKIVAEISADGRIEFYNEKGDVLLREPKPHLLIPGGREYRSALGGLYKIDVRFEANDGEKIYGLGQHRHGLLDQKGCVIPLEQRNCEVSIPFAMSNRGYGFLWNNPAVGRVEFGNTGTRWVAEASRQIDYFITAGDSPREIMEQYTAAAGRTPMLPEFASGFWQCKLRYKTQDELLSIAHEYRRRGLPLSVIVIDFFHGPTMGSWKFNDDEWPDPSAMAKELDEMGIKIMVSVWPAVTRNSENFREMSDAGFLLGSERGIPVYMSMRDRSGSDDYLHYYDPTNPDARKYVWEKVRDGYYKHGIRVWWLDACEPEMYPYHPDNVRYRIGSGFEVGCLYPWMHQKAFYDGMRSEGENEIITLCRSAWAGSQRFGAAVWSGDIFSTFESLHQQVRAGLNIAMSGIPWWTTDIGGFMGGNINDPGFRELIVRWFQFGTFCPLFRLHGYREPVGDSTGGDNEAWSFGDEAYEIIKKYMFIREKLRPYIMQQMRAAHETGCPVMRPLFFDFPSDEKTWTIDSEYMFGPDILVAPVTKPGVTGWEVYLPAGTKWRDAWTGEEYEGGQSIVAEAPLERMPLYVRDGADKIKIHTSY